jgi:hypothetical protein
MSAFDPRGHRFARIFFITATLRLGRLGLARIPRSGYGRGMNAILPLLLLCAAEPPAASLYCATPIAAKGEIKAGPPLAHAFELVNRFPHTVTITKVEAGCGCVKRTLSAQVLKPGETATLTVDVNTLTQPDGPNRWQAIVGFQLDDAQKNVGEVALNITATLSRDVTISPPQLGFSTTGEATQSLTIADRRAKTLSIVKTTSSSPHLAATVGPKGIEVKLAADAPAGQRDEVVVIQTNDPEYPEFRIPVRINKKAAGRIAASPEEISVRLNAGQEEVSSLVQLRAPDGKNIRIESATSDFGAASAKFSTAAGPVATVRVSVGGIAASQPGSCKITVKLAEPAGQTVVIPVTWKR